MTNEISPNTLNKWADRIAAELEPEREPLASLMMEAYLRGGRDRKELFQNAHTLGGVLPDGGISLLPYAYEAFFSIVAALKMLHDSGGTQIVIDALNTWKAWLDVVKGRLAVRKDPPPPHESVEFLNTLRRTLDEVEHTLRKQGLSKEQRERIAYHVMKVLLKMPDETARLIGAR